MKTMKKVSRRLLSVLLSVIIMLLVCPIFPVAYPDENQSGIKRSAKVTSNISYVLYNDGDLIISGEGDFIADYYRNNNPFGDAKRIIVEDGITSIPAWCFQWSRAESIYIADSVTSIDMGAFYRCSNLSILRLPTKLNTIAEQSLCYCENLKTLFIPKSIKYIDFFNFWYYSPEILAYEGTEEEWKKVKIVKIANDGINNATIVYNATASDCFDDILAQEEIKQFPDGYNFETDGWSFHNFKRKSTEQQFKNIFMPSKAHLLYLSMGDYGMGGNCYGMALTTIALMNNTPSADSFSCTDGSSRILMSDIQRHHSMVSNSTTESQDDFIVVRDERINDEGVYYYRTYSVSEYINYGLLTYLGSETVECDRYDCVAVYNAVKEYVYGQRSYPPIIIIAKDKSGTECHAVLGVGIDGNKIIVNDSNHENTKCYLELKQENNEFTGEWTYLGYQGNNTDEQGMIEWTDGSTCSYPYTALQNDLYLDAKNGYLSKGEEIEQRMQRMSENEMLFISNTDAYKTEREVLSRKALFPSDESNTSKQNAYLYWISDTDKKTFTFSDIQEDGSEFMLSDNYSAIYATVSKDSEIQLTVDDNNENSYKLTTPENAPVAVSFITTDNQENIITATVTGTASGDTVTAEETDGGIQVTGLNDMTVTLETADGTDEISVPVDDGETVNITVDDENNTVTTDWQCKHPDENRDGVCDVCGEDFTKDCSCICHSDCKLVQFFYKIARFFRKLFGVESKRYCECGKAHW